MARLDIPPSIEDKIRTKHNLTGDEVRAALVFQRDARFAERDHEVYGRRILAMATTRSGKPFIAWLYAVRAEEGIYRLATAYSK